MKKPYFIKICGITTIEDAVAAVEAGATAIGLNFYPKSKRYIEPEKAKAIADAVRSKTAVVGIFVNHSQESVRQIASSVKLTFCQFHGDEKPELVNSFSNAIKSFRINNSLRNIDFDEYQCNSFLLDTLSETKYGGTGKTFNWLLAREANAFGKIILAGGLNAENVKQAIETAQPWGVDVSSGVEDEPGKKDHKKIYQFIHNAREAFEELVQ
jgi:phosphoribosylanthranilate isomerase